jgi:hypothetical protein
MCIRAPDHQRVQPTTPTKLHCGRRRTFHTRGRPFIFMLSPIPLQLPHRTSLSFNLPKPTARLRFITHLLRRHVPRRTRIEIAILSTESPLRCRWRRAISIAVPWLLILLCFLAKEAKCLDEVVSTIHYPMIAMANSQNSIARNIQTPE